jgi:hypothetical protein
MAGDKGEPTSQPAAVLKIWSSLSGPPFIPAPASWNPLANLVRIAEGEAQELESQLNKLVNESDARLRAASLCEPLLADAGLNRWLRREREEAYSDWLEWILGQLQRSPGSAVDVLAVLGISDPEIVASCQSRAFEIEREYCIPGRRLDLLLTINESVMVIIEVKKYSAETSDTAKQAPYFEWLEGRRFPHRKALLLVSDAAEEKYQNFDRLLWADLCTRLRRLLPELSIRLELVKTAMFVAFVGAVETNLLSFVPPSKENDAIERLSYARTIEHLKKYLEVEKL